MRAERLAAEDDGARRGLGPQAPSGSFAPARVDVRDVSLAKRCQSGTSRSGPDNRRMADHWERVYAGTSCSLEASPAGVQP